jgi:putative flippase GtrA
MTIIPNRIYILFDRFFFQRTFFFFLMTGFLTAVVYFSIFALMWNLLHLNYKVSLTAAYWGGLCFHFFMNRHVTFKSSCNIGRQVIKYLIMSFVNYLIALLITVAVVSNFHFSPYIGIVLSVCVTVMSGYLMSRFWVFRYVE